jgi:hypothetical protein
LQSANFELPRSINRVINEFGSAVATRDQCHFGNLPKEIIVSIIEFAYVDQKLIPMRW